jgi:hypothetical protein
MNHGNHEIELIALLLILPVTSYGDVAKMVDGRIHWNLSLDSEGRIADLSPIDVVIFRPSASRSSRRFVPGISRLERSTDVPSQPGQR